MTRAGHSRLLQHLFAVSLLCAVRVPPAMAQNARLDTLVFNGPIADKINIVIFSEAYPAVSLARFRTEALALAQYFLNTQPMTSYTKSFNAFAISVPSADSGADRPSAGIYRNTFFNSTFETSGIDRLLTIDGVGSSRVDSLSLLLMPQYDIRLVLVNDTRYGGSGGYLAVASINSSSAEVAVHELGHSFGHLADEYTSAYPGWVPHEYPNATQVTNRSSIAWNGWILSLTPVPTPVAATTYRNSMGLIEGAQYQTTGWYRPKYNCKMNALGVDFCDACQKALVDHIAQLTAVVPLAGPAPLQPATGATGVNASGLQLRWHGALSAVRYRTQFATDSLFTSCIVDTLGTDTVRTLPLLGGGTKYYWRVQALKPGMFSPFSSIFSFTTAPLVHVTSPDASAPLAFALGRNFPNPFNPATEISFQLSEPGWTTLKIFDLLGREVAMLLDESLQPGRYEIRWNARGEASGCYIALLRSGEFSAARRLVLVR